MYQFYFDYTFNKDQIPSDLGIPVDQIEPLMKYTNLLSDQMSVSLFGTTVAKSVEAGLELL